MILPLLADMIGTDTGVTVGLVLALASVLGSAIASHINLRAAQTQMKLDQDAEKAARQELAARVRSLEEWKIRQDALDEERDKASGSTARGTKPYPR